MTETTNLDDLHVPRSVVDGIGEERAASLVAQSIPVNVTWWNERLERHGLPGGPVLARNARGSTVESGIGRITRGDVFEIGGTDLTDVGNVCRLLWHSLAWGAGLHVRACDQRMKAVEDGGASLFQSLSKAAELSRRDCTNAYLTVCPAPHQNLVKHMGPAFATKFLYFSGAGSRDHPCLILDRVVATALRTIGGWSDISLTGFWPVSTYDRYCNLAHRWARDASGIVGRTVSPDEIELALFKNGR
jgi:hypothetical protein